MKVKGRIFSVVVISLGLSGLLGIPGYPAEDSAIMRGIVVDKEIPQVAAVPKKDQLILVSFSAFEVGGKAVGTIVLYDDPATERAVDYLELYDQGGDLLAVAWFDRFGIERTAVDRGLLENADNPEGIFVVLLPGDFI
jgi:hypothetical protein